MLSVQRLLRDGRTLDDLNKLYGIDATHSETDPLVILNYDQIESPKTHPVVRECRGLVLEKDTWNVVARAFTRFFNYGETDCQFDWSKFTATTKEDGSLLLLYRYAGG